MGQQRRIVAVLAAVAVFALIVGMARMASSPQTALLYSGLDPASADQIVTVLEGEGTFYEVRGDSIFVPIAERDRLRLRLAGQGLPQSGGAGYELLEGLSGFGTTSQMFDAAYWRAKEGELARTILASPGVRAARVHIAREEGTAFARNTQVSAAVTVTYDAPPLPRAQAESIRFLVSSAVSGLAARDVSVIDAEAGVILTPGDIGGMGDASNPFDDRAAMLKANIERLLAARVGGGRAIVEVMIDADMDSETITERRIDPDTRVAIHSDLEEERDSASGSTGGGVTVASNLPDGEGGASSGRSEQSSRTRELINYEVSEVMRERVRPAGQIRRITVAVLVDGIRTIGEDGAREWTARGEDEMSALAELVRSAIGFDAARGDVVTIRSLEFPAQEIAGTEVRSDPIGAIGARLWSLAEIAVLGFVALLIGLFVLRPLLKPREADLLPNPLEIEGEVLSGSGQVVKAIEENPEARALEERKPSGIEELRGLIQTEREAAKSLLHDWIESEESKA
ncbi:flagellar M-ring protein FliF [Rubricella aquisinus]|uniref:Flagellar M-ring protein n=2 Tax=Rubricella aquisinus TaxID=2028108 RepID=A0A840X7B2_9RHOB|nr:flagellar M-ring protein FliF [Rubricella aquisinus]